MHLLPVHNLQTLRRVFHYRNLQIRNSIWYHPITEHIHLHGSIRFRFVGRVAKYSRVSPSAKANSPAVSLVSFRVFDKGGNKGDTSGLPNFRNSVPAEAY